MEILKDVYQVFGAPYSNINNIFVIKGSDGLVMTDSGENAEELEAIKSNMAYWGLDKYPLRAVLVSHKHFGHIGNLAELRREGAEIIAGEADSDAIEKNTVNAYNDFSAFPIREYEPCIVDRRVRDGDKFNTAGLSFEVIHVPGHTDGSVFYSLTLNGKVIFLTGDVLNVEGDCQGAKLGWEGGEDFNRELYAQSVYRFSKMHCDILLPAHYQLCLTGADKILKDAFSKVMVEWRQPSVSAE